MDRVCVCVCVCVCWMDRAAAVFADPDLGTEHIHIYYSCVLLSIRGIWILSHLSPSLCVTVSLSLTISTEDMNPVRGLCLYLLFTGDCVVSLDETGINKNWLSQLLI